MSVIRHVTVWSLRALALWGAFELSLRIHAVATEQIATVHQINGHRAAMLRYAERVEEIDQATEAAQRVSLVPRGIWILNDADAAASLVREALNSGGAQAAVVDAEASALGNAGLMHVHLRARWREYEATSPSVLVALSASQPHLRVTRLSLSRLDDGFVATDAEFQALAQIEDGGP